MINQPPIARYIRAITLSQRTQMGCRRRVLTCSGVFAVCLQAITLARTEHRLNLEAPFQHAPSVDVHQDRLDRAN
jgi:hypothetical protein